MNAVSEWRMVKPRIKATVRPQNKTHLLVQQKLVK